MKTVAFFTLGCKVNIYESNALMNDFKKLDMKLLQMINQQMLILLILVV